jgi:hypothetical protein
MSRWTKRPYFQNKELKRKPYAIGDKFGNIAPKQNQKNIIQTYLPINAPN